MKPQQLPRNRKMLSVLLAGFAVGMVLTSHSLAFADEPKKKKASLQVEIELPPNTDVKPEEVKLTKKRGMGLVGKWGSPDQPGNTPDVNFKVGVQLPSHLGVLGLDSLPVPGETSAENPQLKEYLFKIPLEKLEQESTFKLVLPSGKLLPMIVKTKLKLGKPFLIKSPGCKQSGLFVSAVGKVETPTVLYINCGQVDQEYIVSVRSLADSQFSQFSPGTTKNPTDRSITQKAPITAATGSPVLAFSVSESAAQTPNPGNYLITKGKVKKTNRLIAIVGVGPTLVDYSESITTAGSVKSTSLSQVGMTGKMQLGFVLIPGKFDLAFSTFGTLAALTHSPETIPSARWLGINFRLGYTLRFGQSAISFLPGIYAWSMYVASNAYGLKNLNGPQVVMSYRYTRASGLGTGGYVKYAAMMYGTTFSGIGNREMAVGLFSDFKIFRPINFAVDVSTLGFTIPSNVPNVSGGLSLFTASFSIGTSFGFF